MALADVQQHRLDSLLLDRLAMRELHLEAALIEVEGGVDVLDGDSDVVDPSEHGAEVYAPVAASVRSTRRISSSAAAATSSCAGVGSLVATRRWISRPG